MSDSRQAFWGVLAAIMSVLIIFGSLALSMMEGGIPLAQALTPTDTITVDTPMPGEPTFTSSPTSPPTDTPTLPAPRTACAPPPDWQPIAVQFGDTFSSLAETYSTTVEALQAANCLPTDGILPDGSIVYVPPVPPTFTSTPTLTATLPPPPPPSPTPCGPPRGWVPYTVRSGDTLFSLAQEVGVSVPQLQRANCLASPNLIRAGSTIYLPRLPVRQPSPTATTVIIPSDTPIPPSPTASATPTTEVPPTSRPTSSPTITLTPTETPIPPTATDTPPPPSPSPTPTPTETTPPPTETLTLTPEPGLKSTGTFLPRFMPSTISNTIRR